MHGGGEKILGRIYRDPADILKLAASAGPSSSSAISMYIVFTADMVAAASQKPQNLRGEISRDVPFALVSPPLSSFLLCFLAVL